jgi:hypothetical protein
MVKFCRYVMGQDWLIWQVIEGYKLLEMVMDGCFLPCGILPSQTLEGMH